MRNIQGNILTPKGQIAPRARDLIATRLIDEFDASNWEHVEGQKTWIQSFQDSNGNVVYAVLEMKVTANNPLEQKSAKASTKKAEVIEWC